MGSISYHIMPLVINNLGAVTHKHTHTNTHTHTHTQAHIQGLLYRNNFKKPGVYQPVAGMPGLINNHPK